MDRIVVVGCGSIGKRHAVQLTRRQDIAVELCDISDSNIADVRDVIGRVPTHRNFEDMLATRPAMLVLATPPKLHASQAIAALESGVHVLCEKPMCDTVENARRMCAAADASGCILDVGFVLHFHPAMQAIKEAITAGRLGQILHIHWHIGTYETLFRSVSRHQAELFGALALDYAHQPDLLYWWLGRNPISVYAVGLQAGVLPLTSNPNVMSMVLQYESTPLATINLNFVQQPGRAHCEIVGDQGWAYVDLATSTIRLGTFDGARTEDTAYANDRDELFRLEQQAFIDAVRGRRQVESPPSSAIQSMLVVEAAIDSLRSGVLTRIAALEPITAPIQSTD